MNCVKRAKSSFESFSRCRMRILFYWRPLSSGSLGIRWKLWINLCTYCRTSSSIRIVQATSIFKGRPRREKADLPHFGRNCCCRNYHYETEDITHMKKIISTCIALMVSAACSISAFAMEVPTNTTIQDLNGVRQYIKIYTVARWSMMFLNTTDILIPIPFEWTRKMDQSVQYPS